MVEVQRGGAELARHLDCRLDLDAPLVADTPAAPTPTTTTPTPSPLHPFEWKAWTEATVGTSGDEISGRTGSWVVPGDPVKPTKYDLFYLGMGVMPQSNDVILQTMLQWGYGAPNGGTQSWTMASWIVGPGGGFFTTQVDVGEGMVVSGSLAKLPATSLGNSSSSSSISSSVDSAVSAAVNGSHWLVTSSGRGRSVNFTADATSYDKMVWAYNLGSVYNLGSCDQYPGSSLVFSNLTMKSDKGGSLGATLPWTPRAESKYPLKCKEHATTTGPGDSTIHWNGL